MNPRLETLAHDKESLLMRSALCRLRLRRDANDVRQALHWKRAASAVAAAPALRRVALGLALSVVGLSRATRLVLVAGRIVLAAKLARALLGHVRSLATRPRAP